MRLSNAEAWRYKKDTKDFRWRDRFQYIFHSIPTLCHLQDTVIPLHTLRNKSYPPLVSLL